MQRIFESGMEFGPFNDKQVFYIETSKLHGKIGKGIRTVEFLLSTDPSSLLFLEAKSSSPKPGGDISEKFDAFIQEISEKFIHSFELYYSAILKRHETSNDIPDSFKQLNNEAISIKFCLVINGHAIDWLPPIREALAKRIAPYITIWGIKVAVLNDELAKVYRLIA